MRVILLMLLLAGQVQAGLAMRGLAAVRANQHNWWSSDALDSCVAYWRPGVNGTANDTVSTNDATGYGGASVTDNGFSLDGVNDYFKTDNVFSALDNENTYTVSVWCKSDTLGVNQYLFNTGCNYKPVGVSDGGYFRFTTDNIIRALSQNTATVKNCYSDSDDVQNDLKWHNIVCVFYLGVTFGGIDLYIDGELVDSTIIVDGGGVYNLEITIQAYIGLGFFSSGPTGYFDGFIDEMAVFDEGLTASQVLKYYNKSKATFEDR